MPSGQIYGLCRDHKTIYKPYTMFSNLSDLHSHVCVYETHISMYPYILSPQALFLLLMLPGTTLERLSLIQYHVLPLDSLEILYILHHQLVTGDNHMEGGILSVEGLL